jgi:hypothetical protein
MLCLKHLRGYVIYGRKVLRVQRDLQYSDFGSHPMLKMEISNILLMT